MKRLWCDSLTVKQRLIHLIYRFKSCSHHKRFYRKNKQTQKASERLCKMAQKITRTVVTTLVTCKVIDKNTEELSNYVVAIPGAVNDEEKAKKLCLKEINDSNYAFIKITNTEFVEALYEMPLTTFIEHATIVTE